VADLRRPQTVSIGHQDHGRVAMAVAAMLAGAVHQALDLALGEIASLDCQVYDAWCAFFGCRFHADKLCLRVSYCMYYTPQCKRGERGDGGHRDRNAGWRRRGGGAAGGGGPSREANLILSCRRTSIWAPR